MDRIDVGVVALSIAGAAAAAWLAAQRVPAEAAPVAAVTAPAPTRPRPCPRPPGLAKPRSGRVDPELDAELVGVATPWPDDVDPRWTEEGLAPLLRDPRDALHCEEWPCLVELHADDDTPRSTGDTLDAGAVLADWKARGWDVGHVQLVVRPAHGEDGPEEVLVAPLRPRGRDPTPDESLREAVRQFWLLESLQ